MIHENRLKKNIHEKKISIGSIISTLCPAYIEVLGKLNYDFILIDTEHGHYSVEEAFPLIMAADIWDVTPIVKVIENKFTFISKALDLGAQGIIIPHVHSEEDLRNAIKSAYYPPHGERRSAPYIRSADFIDFEWGKFQELSDEDTIVIPCIEDEKGIENIDEILGIEEVEVYCLSPFGYSIDIGAPGDRLNPRVEEMMIKVAEKISNEGKYVMYPVMSIEEAGRWIERGVNILVYGSDTFIYGLTLKKFVDEVKADTIIYESPKKLTGETEGESLS